VPLPADLHRDAGDDEDWAVPGWFDGPPRPTALLPLRTRAWAWLRVQLTWPRLVREMKAAGYRRAGWRTWGPDEPPGP
jgi:hypothetical protein